MTRILSAKQNGRKGWLAFSLAVLISHIVTMSATGQTRITKSDSLLSSLASKTSNNLKVSFTYSPRYPVEGQAVQFSDGSTGNAISWQWDFGDGTTSTARNPIHVFTTSGFKRITLAIANGASSKRATRTLTVMPSAAPATFVFSPTTPGPGQTVQFADTTSGSPTSWRWDFGDGATSNAKNPSHVFARTGSYIVALTASNTSSLKQGSQTLSVTSISVLTSAFTFAPASPAVGQAVQFTDTSAGSPTAWSWSFGDGSTSTAQNPGHTYTSAGTKTVSLTVTSSSGSNTTTRAVTVAAALSASFTFAPASPAAGQAVQFTDKSLGTPTLWQWNFNDGTTSSVQNPSHSFTSAGSYSVSLTVMNASGQNSVSQIITVVPAASLAASFTFSPASPVVGQAVQFTDASTGTPTSWQWNFGDGTTSAAKNPSHVFATQGSYSTALIVSNGSSSSSTNNIVSVGYADVITAASPSYADVSAAVAAASRGDTVIVPAGAATWASQLVVTEGIYIIGAGNDATTGTRITSSYVGRAMGNPPDPSNYLVVYQPSVEAQSANAPFRFSGFRINCAGICSGIELYNYTSTLMNQARIDNNFITGTSGKCIYIMGNLGGVVDSNEIDVNGLVFGARSTSSSNWSSHAFYFSNAYNIYFEDNTVTSSNTFVDGGAGGQYCLRHNTFTYTGTVTQAPAFDMHGNDPVSSASGMITEIYDNTIISINNNQSNGLDLRGGKGLYYNNNLISNGQHKSTVQDEHPDSDNLPATDIDGNPQHVNNTYFFNNKRNGVVIFTNMPVVTSMIDYGGGHVVPTENKEFWTQKASFDGTSGVGVGLLAGRPVTCTIGVGYWATDENKLYRCTATNTWGVFYTPYQYPHPLRKLP
jgi:PKD repeat protein